jgi:uncharacterized protein (DUF2141 family)
MFGFPNYPGGKQAMTKPLSAPCLWLFIVAAMVSGLSATAQQATVAISGKVIGASGNHPIYVALWDSSGFLTKASQQIRIDSHSSTQFQFHVAPGAWAMSAYEDENENGKLDFGIFAPKEPSGFWRPFHGWHKPRFSEVSSAVGSDVSNADIELRK